MNIENFIKIHVQFYIDQILNLHNVKSVILAGSSLGGNIAIEMSRLLEKNSIKVHQIHLFDTVEFEYFRSKNKYFSMGQLLFFQRELRESMLTELAICKFNLIMFFKLLPKDMNLDIENTFLQRLESQKNEQKKFKLFWKFLLELGKYSINFNKEIQIACYQANESKKYKFEDCLGWKSVAPNLKFFVIKGGHITMFEKPYVYELAEVMSSFL